MLTISAGKFKAKCLKLMDEVRDHHEEIIITKFNRPVAKVVPIAAAQPPKIYGYLRDSVTELGDIVGPTGETWEADQAGDR